MNGYQTSEKSEAYIALGANLGDRQATLMEAVTLLDQHPDIQVERCSNLYETEPVGYMNQPAFLNMALTVSTRLQPIELLRAMLEIENQLGRVRDVRWGPRTVDLDLIWMEGLQLDTPELMLPHPRMRERAFVLVPLSDIVSPDTSGLYNTVKSALAGLDGREGIQLWTTCSWHSGSAPSVN
ncbi:2-amino-4-hydroxy-6-hydroxymethyldihydropteridine diphosphokinase [Paenibacillus sp. JX-17]|uniref:2-amino-4-hydroxy-6-hydroxymethyldihydropteridine diphosphokinase n=1 Tax=Paenibacillus lacisoli TaxID=3064525 RepID=A0ABT9CH37_9BACL|nr:2-amino-4-hydroxy-6-hydroxymethyldihydropteridine diphosphokinase [Paenibacillus sp. JX-17]MDO7908598.1 2-amino-4-hydroxy-6-hydroxymethyldihydropteridine diphosphokinase [Paenibacillus sp. JX-17]